MSWSFEVAQSAWLAGGVSPIFEVLDSGCPSRPLVLSTIDRDILKRNAAVIVAALDAVVPGTVREVDCGSFSRKKT